MHNDSVERMQRRKYDVCDVTKGTDASCFPESGKEPAWLWWLPTIRYLYFRPQIKNNSLTAVANSVCEHFEMIAANQFKAIDSADPFFILFSIHVESWMIL